MKKIFFSIIAVFFINISLSQSNLLNAKSPNDIDKLSDDSNDGFNLEYDSISEQNILWSRVVYEYIDLNEKLNFPLLYPINDDVFRKSRKSLWKTIYDGIKSGKITELYEADNDKFIPNLKIVQNHETPYNDIIDFYVDEAYRNGDINNGQQLGSDDILGYNIKGIWYFDKLQSELKYRLLCIQPYGIDVKDKFTSELESRETLKSVYPWIWYPSIRKILHESKVFNEKNNSNSISFDDLLINRRFSSFIYKYNNVYGDREIKDYIKQRPGESKQQHNLRLILESERIKKEILDFELDMWGY
jgi:gliding motility associated protien GldN